MAESQRNSGDFPRKTASELTHAHLNNGEEPEELCGFLKFAVEKQVQQLIARPCAFTYLTVNIGYSDATNEYDKLLNYIEKYPEPGKTQLTAILFPVFVHLYLLMLQNSPDEETGAENSDAFFMKYRSVFLAAKGYETVLKELHALKSVTAVEKHEDFSKFWKMKYIIKASVDVLQDLRKFLEDIESKALPYVLNFHFYYESDDLSVSFEAEESKCDDTENDSQNILMNFDPAELLLSGISPVYVAYEIPYFSSADFNDDESEISIACHNSSLGIASSLSSCIYVASLDNTSRSFKEIKLPEATALKYVPGKSDVILASYKNNVKLINTTTKEDILNYKIQHTAKIWSVDVNPSGLLFATASQDFSVCIWNLNDRVAVKQYCGHDLGATVVKFHPNGFYFATGSADVTILLWTIEKSIPLRCFSGHEAKITSIAFSPDGTMIVSADSIGVVKLWDIRECKELGEVTGVEAAGSNLCFNDVNTQFGFCNDKGVLRIWDVRYMKEIICENYGKSPLAMKFNKREWKIAFKQN